MQDGTPVGAILNDRLVVLNAEVKARQGRARGTSKGLQTNALALLSTRFAPAWTTVQLFVAWTGGGRGVNCFVSPHDQNHPETHCCYNESCDRAEATEPVPCHRTPSTGFHCGTEIMSTRWPRGPTRSWRRGPAWLHSSRLTKAMPGPHCHRSSPAQHLEASHIHGHPKA